MQSSKNVEKPALIWTRSLGVIKMVLPQISSAFGVLAKGLANAQTARMITILQGMSQDELKQIGVKRCDIPQYARYLVS